MFTTPHVKKDQTHTAMAHMKNEGTVGKNPSGVWFHLDWSLEGGEEKNLTQMTEEKPHHTKTDEAAE